MENPIIISNLNDFIFCPASIYFHNIYGQQDRRLYQSEKQLNGTKVHETVDEAKNNKNVLHAMDVYCEKYDIIGKIDYFDTKSGVLIERKKHVTKVYDGQVFQVYAQYFALTEMGYTVRRIVIHSYDDNKNYDVPLPENDDRMARGFERVIEDMKRFDISTFTPRSSEKCSNCIYNDVCSVSLI